MEDGFWLFIIFQLIALSPWAERLELDGARRYVLIGGLVLSILCVFFTLLLSYGEIESEVGRGVMRWLLLLTKVGAVAATAVSFLLPAGKSSARAK